MACAILCVIGVLAWARAPEAATRTAANCTAREIQAKINAAADGDTVQLPACGPTSITQTITVDKAITLIGAGIGVTTLVDNIPSVSGNRASLINVTTSGNAKCWRLSGFSVVGGTETGSTYNNGRITIASNSHCFRIDHVRLANLAHSYMLKFWGDNWGVIDHSEFETCGGTLAMQVFDDQDLQWTQPARWGSQAFVFIEDNKFTPSAGCNWAGAMDSEKGGRWVFRHNTLVKTGLANHGTDSGSGNRSIRAMEIYENTWDLQGVGVDAVIDSRGGGALIWGNTLVNPGAVNFFYKGSNFRDIQPYAPWGKCDGSSPWDQNGPGGYACVDQIGRGEGAMINTAAPKWPGQVLDPVYVWGNTMAILHAGGNTPNVKVGRDILLSQKPGYTPYTYPHPLVTGR